MKSLNDRRIKAIRKALADYESSGEHGGMPEDDHEALAAFRNAVERAIKMRGAK